MTFCLCININPSTGTLKTQSNGPSYKNTGTLAVDGWGVTFGTVRRGLGGLGPRPRVGDGSVGHGSPLFDGSHGSWVSGC